MCGKYSWIKKNGAVIILTAKDLFHTERGTATQNHCNNDPTEFYGHGAIMWYYDLNPVKYGGCHREKTDLKTPAGFPKELIAAILAGDMAEFGIDKTSLDIFSKAGLNKFLVRFKLNKAWTARSKASATYDKASATYDKAWVARSKAWTARSKAWTARSKASATYDKASATYDKAWVAYDKAWVAHNKARAAYDKAWVAHNKAWTACSQKDMIIHYKRLLKNKKNLNKNWH